MESINITSVSTTYNDCLLCLTTCILTSDIQDDFTIRWISTGVNSSESHVIATCSWQRLAVNERRNVSDNTNIITEDRSWDVYPHLRGAVGHFVDLLWTEDNLGFFIVLRKRRGNINKRDSFRSCDHGEKHGAKLYLFTFVASFLLKYSCSKNFVILSS